jgi:hypothetical protein
VYRQRPQLDIRSKPGLHVKRLEVASLFLGKVHLAAATAAAVAAAAAEGEAGAEAAAAEGEAGAEAAAAAAQSGLFSAAAHHDYLRHADASDSIRLKSWYHQVKTESLHVPSGLVRGALLVTVTSLFLAHSPCLAAVSVALPARPTAAPHHWSPAGTINSSSSSKRRRMKMHQ